MYLQYVDDKYEKRYSQCSMNAPIYSSLINNYTGPFHFFRWTWFFRKVELFKWLQILRYFTNHFLQPISLYFLSDHSMFKFFEIPDILIIITNKMKFVIKSKYVINQSSQHMPISDKWNAQADMCKNSDAVTRIWYGTPRTYQKLYVMKCVGRK